MMMPFNPVMGPAPGMAGGMWRTPGVPQGLPPGVGPMGSPMPGYMPQNFGYAAPPAEVPFVDDAEMISMARQLVSTRPVTREELIYEGRIIEAEAREAITDPALATHGPVLTAANFENYRWDGQVDYLQQRSLPAPLARSPNALASATNFVDTTGDGRPNVAFMGVDMNRDGVVDAMQRQQMAVVPRGSPYAASPPSSPMPPFPMPGMQMPGRPQPPMLAPAPVYAAPPMAMGLPTQDMWPSGAAHLSELGLQLGR